MQARTQNAGGAGSGEILALQNAVTALQATDVSLLAADVAMQSDITTLQTDVAALQSGGGGTTITGASSNIVVGPKIIGSYPPQMAASTTASKNALINAGVPVTAILWLIQGAVAS